MKTESEILREKREQAEKNRAEHIQVAAVIAAGMLAKGEWLDKAIPQKAVQLAAEIIDIIDPIY